MKNFKKLMALVIAGAMVIGTMSFAGAEGVGNLTPDTSVTVGGLENGDVAHFYKLIKWVDSEGWAWADGFDDAVTSIASDLTAEEAAKVADATAKAALLKEITGYYDTSSTLSGSTEVPLVPGVISAANGGLLAKIALAMGGGTAVTAASNQAVYEKPNGTEDDDFVGLYVALIDPATPDYMYNPVFVAADFGQSGKEIEWDTHFDDEYEVKLDTLSYTDKALAKKEYIHLTKESGTQADKQYDIKVGDTIPFHLASKIPAYSTSYVDPIYVISDVMSTGLKLNTEANKIIVKVAGAEVAEGENTYSVVKSETGFTITFKAAYLKDASIARDITVDYEALVDFIPAENVVEKDNEATVKFSNNPNDEDDYSLLEDRTSHYTFSLDANLLGNSEWENSELVKIGISADGTEITKQEVSNGTSHGVLQGADFALYTTPEAAAAATNSEKGIPYSNSKFNGFVTSDAMGKLLITGLDAGTYYLKELKAPAGYIKSTDVYKIDIVANYKDIDGGTYVNGDGKQVRYDAYKVLKDYSVTVSIVGKDGNVSSSFTITNAGVSENIKASVASSTDNTARIANTQGTELPSTGGMGTTLFYAIGAILVLGAGILLVSKRRMAAN